MADSVPETIRLIIDSTPALIHTARPDGYIDFFNQTWLRYVGLRLEKIKAGIGPVRFIRTLSKALDLTLYSPLEYKIYAAAGASLHPPRLGSGTGKSALSYGK